MQVNPLHPLFAAELVGADLTAPPSEELVRTVEDAMARYGVLAIRDAEIDDEQHKDFSRAFGPLELPSRVPGAARPVGRPNSSSAAIERAASALRNRRTRGPTVSASWPHACPLCPRLVMRGWSHRRIAFATVA